MKILFLGSGEIAIPSFRALLASSHDVLGLVTQPDKPVGRKQVMTGPPIKQVALDAGVEVFQPESLKSAAAVEKLRAWSPDLVVVMAYGQILSQEVIDIPALGTINLHASLLPRYRGASCIQAALAAGDEVTGVTCMYVARQLDAGDIIGSIETPISREDTGGCVHDRLADLAVELLLPILDKIQAGIAPRVPQDDALASYAPKLGRADGKLDWDRPVAEIARLVRAYDPWPGTWTGFVDAHGKSRMLKVFPPVEIVWLGEGCQRDECMAGDDLRAMPPGSIREVAGSTPGEGAMVIRCADHALKVSRVQPDGSRVQSSDEFLRGHSSVTRLG